MRHPAPQPVLQIPRDGCCLRSNYAFPVGVDVDVPGNVTVTGASVGVLVTLLTFCAALPASVMVEGRSR
jgi:hypothetical protein